MRVIATTVVRESIRGKQKTGYIYDIDWDALKVRTSLAVPDPSYPESDDNPRGGVRGGRGVAVTKDGILVANYDTVYTYDDEWNQLDSYSHPLFIGTHEVDWDGRHLYMAATGIDVVLRYDPKTRSVETVWDPHGARAGRALQHPEAAARGRRHRRLPRPPGADPGRVPHQRGDPKRRRDDHQLRAGAAAPVDARCARCASCASGWESSRSARTASTAASPGWYGSTGRPRAT